tara:strand:- start:409 stop:651 length:243 start_codon:yes stop_codon:yes gene_type:complete
MLVTFHESVFDPVKVVLNESTNAPEEVVEGCVFQVTKSFQLPVTRDARILIAKIAGEFVPVISSVAELTVEPAKLDGNAN